MEVDIPTTEMEVADVVNADMSPEEIAKEEKYTDIFNFLDKDGSGQLDKKELRKAMNLGGNWDLTKFEFDKVMETCDTDRDGFISREEFTPLMDKAMSCKPSEEDILREREEALYPLFNTDDGCIDSNDFRRMLTEKGEECMTDAEVNEMFEECEISDKDRLTKDDVLRCFQCMS